MKYTNGLIGDPPLSLLLFPHGRSKIYVLIDKPILPRPTFTSCPFPYQRYLYCFVAFQIKNLVVIKDVCYLLQVDICQDGKM